MTEPPHQGPEDDPETIVDAGPTADTQLAPAAEPTESSHAWSLDDGEDWPPRRLTPGRITAIAVAASVVVIAVAAAIGFLHLRDQQPEPAPTAASPTSSTTATPLQPPPATVTTVIVQPPPVTVTAEPPPAPELPPPVRPAPDYDSQFIAAMRSQGWVVIDADMFTRDARLVCTKLATGSTVADVQAQYAAASRGLADARQFVWTAMEIYPSCP